MKSPLNFFVNNDRLNKILLVIGVLIFIFSLKLGEFTLILIQQMKVYFSGNSSLTGLDLQLAILYVQMFTLQYIIVGIFMVLLSLYRYYKKVCN